MRALRFLAVITACASLSCQQGKRRADVDEALPPVRMLTAVPLGDVAGARESVVRGELRNPFADDAAAIVAGEELFHLMNCVACHGYGARGGMGPSLRDEAWRYGGTPAEIYKSIAEGRPKGMPAWGRMLTAELMWKLTAYIQSLGGATSVEEVPGPEGWAAETPKGARGEVH